VKCFFSYIIFFGMGLAACQVHAQLTLGIKGGLTRNYTDLPISGALFIKNEANTGFETAFSLVAGINKWLSIETDPGILQKDNALIRSGTFQGIYEDFKNIYYQLPIKVRFSSSGKQAYFYAMTGCYLGWWASGKIKGEVPEILNITNALAANGQPAETFSVSSYDSNYSFDGRRDNRVEFGWTVGAGYLHNIGRRYVIYAEIDYQQAATSSKKNTARESAPYNRTLCLALGANYRL
jgi:hypothetical protein